MKVIHCISYLSKCAGGPSRSVPALARALAAKGCEVVLTTVDSANRIDLTPQQRLEYVICRPSFPRQLAASREMKQHLRNGLAGDVYHGHGIWELPVHYLISAGRRRDCPRLIAPRGMLEPWAVNRSSLRKRVLGWLYQNRDLRELECLHAITPNSVESFRAYGLKNPIAVVPNGVDLRDLDGLDRFAGAFEAEFPQARQRPIALFLSRIHPKKGIDILLRAWAALRKSHADWMLVIVGPSQLNYQAEMEALSATLGLDDSVLFPGPLYGEKKLAALAAAKVFVLPSHSEGFSMAVLEAMACRLPVLITPGCNFDELGAAKAGVICEAADGPVTDALGVLLGQSETQRREMGERGRALIESKFTWERVADQMIEVYEWLLNKRSRPDCVVE